MDEWLKRSFRAENVLKYLTGEAFAQGSKLTLREIKKRFDEDRNPTYTRALSEKEIKTLIIKFGWEDVIKDE